LTSPVPSCCLPFHPASWPLFLLFHFSLLWFLLCVQRRVSTLSREWTGGQDYHPCHCHSNYDDIGGSSRVLTWMPSLVHMGVL
jgi:hypothetical protein